MLGGDDLNRAAIIFVVLEMLLFRLTKIIVDIEYANLKVIPEKESETTLKSSAREDLNNVIVLPINSLDSFERTWAIDEVWGLLENI